MGFHTNFQVTLRLIYFQDQFAQVWVLNKKLYDAHMSDQYSTTSKCFACEFSSKSDEVSSLRTTDFGYNLTTDFGYNLTTDFGYKMLKYQCQICTHSPQCTIFN